jgi:hypothetical protein
LVPTDADQGTRVFDLTTGEQTGTMNSIGLFTVAVPSSGIGQGSFLIFTEGLSYSGTIVAVGDPGAGTLTGILEATYSYVDFVRDDNGDIVYQATTTNGVTTVAPVSDTFEAAVRGSLNANVESSLASINATSAASGNFGRLSGTAETASLFVGPNGAGELVTDKVVHYSVDGVKQSITADASAVLNSSTTTTTTGNTNQGLGLLSLLGL